MPPTPGLFGRLADAARLFLDLQAASLRPQIVSWLNTRQGALLEVGCGNQPYRRFVSSDCRYQGLDWAGANAAFDIDARDDVVRYDGTRFPWPDGAFNALFHSEVLEHVPDPGTFLRECRRVLVDGGEMLLTVPFQARYHFIPNDYWRFTPSGLENVLAASGFSDIVVIPRGTDVTVAVYKFAQLVYRLAVGGVPAKLAAIIFLPLVIFLLPLAHLTLRWTIGSSDDCLGYTVRARASHPLKSRHA